VKAITLTQPWATLVAIGAKRIETRSWWHQYRGRLAIHAAKAMPDWAMDICAEEPFRSVLLAAGIAGVCVLPRGAVIATCRLADCLPTDAVSPFRLTEQELAFGDYAAGRWAWILEDVKILPDRIPAKGMLGLWEWNELPEARRP